jgi:hypothetical protein
MKTNLFTALMCLTMGMSLPSLLAADKAAPKDTTVVIARGVSINAEKALLSAYRNAVQQVVGVIVDAETLIKNDKVVKDEILDFSNGFVEKFEKIKDGKNDDGLYEVTIKATVKRRQLIERLQKAKVYSAKVDGASLFGSVISEMDAQKKGAKLLEKALSDLNLPYSLLKAEVVNLKPKILKKLDTEIQAQWSIRVQFDMEKYQKVVFPKLKQVLGDIALEKNEQLLLQDPRRVKNDADIRGVDRKGAVFVNPFCSRMEYATFRAPVSKRPAKDVFPIFLLEKWTQSTKQQWYRCYWVDVKSIKVLTEFLDGLGQARPLRELRLSLIGADKSPLYEKSIAWADPIHENSLLVDKGEVVTRLPRQNYFNRSQWVLRPTLISGAMLGVSGYDLIRLRANRNAKTNMYTYYYVAPFMNIKIKTGTPLGFIDKADFLWQPKIPLQVLEDVVGIEVKIQPFKVRNR